MAQLAGRIAVLAMLAAGLAGCATPPPPKGLAPPTASDAGGRDAGAGEASDAALAGAAPGALEVGPTRRLAALRVTVESPPEELLDERGAGVLTLSREGRREPIRLVFGNGALGVYALEGGVYEIDTIAGYDCGNIYLILAPDTDPVALGGLRLRVHGEGEAALSGELPALEDIERVAALTGRPAAAVDAEPLERRDGLACRRLPLAVSRPDIDPTIRRLTPAEIAGVVVLGGLLGGAAGYAAAAGSFVFVSGAGGGLLVLGF